MTSDIDDQWMRRALTLAEQAAEANEVPVGAILVRDDQVIGSGFNSPIMNHDASSHAEIAALRQAGARIGNYRLPGSVLYVTIEPCTMCVGAMIHARIARLVFGAREPRAGAVVSQLQLLDCSHYNHRLDWSEGVLAEECSNLIKAFFKSRRGM